jgi:hypothetical protein
MAEPLTAQERIIQQDMIIDRLREELKREIEKNEKLENEVSNIKIDVARLSERLAIYQLMQAGFATIAAIVAATVARLMP